MARIRNKQITVSHLVCWAHARLHVSQMHFTHSTKDSEEKVVGISTEASITMTCVTQQPQTLGRWRFPHRSTIAAETREAGLINKGCLWKRRTKSKSCFHWDFIWQSNILYGNAYATPTPTTSSLSTSLSGTRFTKISKWVQWSQGK